MLTIAPMPKHNLVNICNPDIDDLRLGEIVAVGLALPMPATIVGRAYQWGAVRYDVMVENQIITNVERELIVKLDGRCIHIDVIDVPVAYPKDAPLSS